MRRSVQSAEKLVWEELLPADEIQSWCGGGTRPIRLQSQFSIPGVYRFVFPEFKDENGQHIPCYVGQSGNLAGRIPFYFRPASQKECRDENGEIILPDGWHVRGQVQNSGGFFRLQVLRVEGAISLCGVVLNHHSLDCPFARVFLENWAILSSRQIDCMVPSNHGISQSTLDLIKMRSESGR